MDINFFAEVLIGGLLSGVMYALVAIGFVLIYKASGVFNFAQGAMVFFAALTCVGFMDKFGFSLWLAIPATIVAMIILGLAIERVVLRPLVNQPEIALFMAPSAWPSSSKDWPSSSGARRCISWTSRLRTCRASS